MIRRTRALEEILQHPETDEEERIATTHIWTEAARIRDAWSDEERRLRALGRQGERALNRDELRLQGGWTAPEYRQAELRLQPD